MAVNILTIQGRLTKDFVNKNGNAYSSIAVDTYKGETMFIDIVAFKQKAEYCFDYLHKGQMVLVSGTLNINKYQDKLYVSCAINEINNLGGGKYEEKEKTNDTPTPVDEPVATDSVDLDDPNLDLPF